MFVELGIVGSVGKIGKCSCRLKLPGAIGAIDAPLDCTVEPTRGTDSRLSAEFDKIRARHPDVIGELVFFADVAVKA